jgi:hypothetical protein
MAGLGTVALSISIPDAAVDVTTDEAVMAASLDFVENQKSASFLLQPAMNYFY